MSTNQRQNQLRSCFRTAQIAILLVLAPGGIRALAQDQLGIGPSAAFRLTDASEFQEGCFEPCLCPIMIVQDMRGAMRLTYAGTENGLDVFDVQDVQFLVPLGEELVTFRGSGTYTVGSPDPITLLQHRLQLTLVRDDANTDPVEFDSGWVPIEHIDRLNITVSMNGMYCFDTVLVIDAARVPDQEIEHYALNRLSYFQRGCWDPCDCPIGEPLPMVGTFDLVPLQLGPTVNEFAVVNADWRAALDNAGNAWIPIHGYGLYTTFAEFAVEHRMLLKLVVGDEPAALFDSGWVVTHPHFPLIQVLMSMNGLFCFDTALFVAAGPAAGEVCGGIQGIPCDEGQFCQLPVGNCCCDFFGRCVTSGGICPTLWDPVCGCDGNTYPNDCEATAVGVSLAHFGPCEQVCASDLDCTEPTQFCKHLEGTCGEVGAGGVCITRPDNGCPEIYDPVCGCDGVTYENECESDAAGVSVRYRGPCDRVCFKTGDPPCLEHEFCKYPIGTCDDPTVAGECTGIPEGCLLDYIPVCGCDGATYSNDCHADFAGVSLAHHGACVPASCAAQRIFPTNDHTYCPYEPLLVRIELTPPPGTSAISLADAMSHIWTVTNISDGGVFDATFNEVKWGPLFAPFPSEVSYALIPFESGTSGACFYGQVSLDGTNEMICADDCLHKDESCPPQLAADLLGPWCPACDVSDCAGCGIDECGNHRITLCELVANACSWKSGCHDDMSGMTRAAYVWRNGECYCWDDVDGAWNAMSCPAPATGLCADATASVEPDRAARAGILAEVSPARIALAPATYVVRMVVNVPSESSAMALELGIPKGWRVQRPSDDGEWDRVHRKVKWGPFLNQQSRTLELTLAPITDTLAETRQPRKHHRQRLPALSGTLSVDGTNRQFAVR